MVFDNRNILAISTALSLFIVGISLGWVIKTKLLGIKLDNLLACANPIDYIVSVMGKGMAISRKWSTYVPSSVMMDSVRSLVLSTWSTAQLFGHVLLRNI